MQESKSIQNIQEQDFWKILQWKTPLQLRFPQLLK